MEDDRKASDMIGQSVVLIRSGLTLEASCILANYLIFPVKGQEAQCVCVYVNNPNPSEGSCAANSRRAVKEEVREAGGSEQTQVE